MTGKGAKKGATDPHLRTPLRLPAGEPADWPRTTPGPPPVPRPRQEGRTGGRRAHGRAPRRACRSGCGQRAPRATGAGCRWCCRAWTPAARAARSSTSSGRLNPSGCRIKAFTAPTEEERRHEFLRRMRRALPQAGEIGIFDRSLPHARLRSRGGTLVEDVLIARVRALAPSAGIESRYGRIDDFERCLADDGVTLARCFPHLSYEQQRRRLPRRLDRPDKHWKFSAGDIDDGALWPAYQQARETARERCAAPHAPWNLVSADRKWYRNWAVGRLLREHLEVLDPHCPKADFDVAACRERLLAEG